MIRRHRTRGQALVEFSLVIPIFLLVLFGIVDMGRYVYSLNSLNEVAREAARQGSVAHRPASCAGLSRTACIQSVAVGKLLTVPVTASNVAVYCQRKSSTGALPNQAAEPPIDNCAGSWRADDLMRVRIDHNFTLVTPLVAQFMGTFNLRGEAQVTVHG